MIDYSHLRNWLTGEGYPVGFHDRPVILECRPSKSGMTMGIFDRDKKIFTVRGPGFSRIGTALGEYLETLFQQALWALAQREGAAPPAKPEEAFNWRDIPGFYGTRVNFSGAKHPRFRNGPVALEGSAGIESMRAIADAIGIHVWVHELRNSTAIVLRKKG